MLGVYYDSFSFHKVYCLLAAKYWFKRCCGRRRVSFSVFNFLAPFLLFVLLLFPLLFLLVIARLVREMHKPVCFCVCNCPMYTVSLCCSLDSLPPCLLPTESFNCLANFMYSVFLALRSPEWVHCFQLNKGL